MRTGCSAAVAASCGDEAIRPAQATAQVRSVAGTGRSAIASASEGDARRVRRSLLHLGGSPRLGPHSRMRSETLVVANEAGVAAEGRCVKLAPHSRVPAAVASGGRLTRYVPRGGIPRPPLEGSEPATVLGFSAGAARARAGLRLPGRARRKGGT